MPHFLIQKEEINNNEIKLINKDNLFHIIKVRRAKINENIKFIDENYIIYNCIIKEITKTYLKAQIISKQKSQRFLKYDLCLIQSILAPDAQNLLIANATQTGVKTIYPVISDNVSNKKNIDKIIKWQKIACENFKQCERADIPEIKEIANLKDVLKEFSKENIIIFAEKNENIKFDNILKNINKNDKIAIVIGPEGGFSENEFNYFKENNFNLVSLGSMIYKAPNAVVAGISNVISRLEC